MILMTSSNALVSKRPLWCRYEHADVIKAEHNRPAVWMPRLCELSDKGRADLKQAIYRYGGASRICRMAGMVPCREWSYFDRQLELFTKLRSYIDLYGGGDYTCFPNGQDIKANGHDRLYSLVNYFGGRSFVASRLGMTASPNIWKDRDGDHFSEMLMFGKFDLVFAIRLLCFVRSDHCLRSPPLQNPVLAMPSPDRLIAGTSDGAWLDQKIIEYGGYENVARRLGLALFPLHRR
jgi:hypothetical protein